MFSLKKKEIITITSKCPIYLPFHKVVRELDGKLFMACNAIQEGFPVIFGRKNSIIKNLTTMEPGIFIDTRMNSSRLTMEKKNVMTFKEAGHEIWAFDEEMTTVDDVATYQQNQISHEVLLNLKGIFCWSDFHANIIKDIDKNVSTYITGHPRYDMYKPNIRSYYNDDVLKIKKRFGEYFLIPSSFGPMALGSIDDMENQIKSNIEKGFFTTDEDVEKYRIKREYRAETARYFIEMLKCISLKFPEMNFVLRPHFADPPGFWEKTLNKKANNLFVSHDGNIAPWILGSRGLIHHHCSTAVEAYLYEKPVISYLPIQNPEYHRKLPALVSKEVHTLIELIDAIDFIVHNSNSHKESIKKNRDELEFLIDHKDELSSTRVINAIMDNSRLLSESKEINKDIRYTVNISIIARLGLIQLVKNLKNFRISNKSNSHEPFIKYQDIRNKISSFQKVGLVPNNINVEQLDSELFLINTNEMRRN